MSRGFVKKTEKQDEIERIKETTSYFAGKNSDGSERSQNTISRYETGEREAGYDMLIRIADYFDISVDYLLERTDDPVWHRREK